MKMWSKKRRNWFQTDFQLRTEIITTAQEILWKGMNYTFNVEQMYNVMYSNVYEAH